MAKSKTAQQVIDIARAKVGYREGYDFKGNWVGSGYSEFGKWYGNAFGGGAYYWAYSDWCAMFCAWCMDQAGLTASETVFTASAGDTGVGMWRSRGMWHDRSGYTPKAGDLIHFTWGHVGVVSKVSSTVVYTIEGNTRASGVSQDCVAEHSYSLWYSGIRGYASPKYKGDEVPAEPDKPTPTPTDVSYKGQVRAIGGLNVREGAGIKYKVLETLPNGSYVVISRELDGWGYVAAKGGWVSLEYIVKVTEPDKKGKIDVTYQVYSNGRWFGWIKNYNNTTGDGYAGLDGYSVSGVRAYLSSGHIKYRVHTVGGKWYSWITDYNLTNDMGYAGVLGAPIDMIQMQLDGLSGYNVKYRVSTKSSNGYLPWVTNYNNINDDGYAGIPGVAIDKLQIEIVAK